MVTYKSYISNPTNNLLTIRNSCGCSCGKVKFCDLFSAQRWGVDAWLRWRLYVSLATGSHVLRFMVETENNFLQKCTIFKIIFVENSGVHLWQKKKKKVLIWFETGVYVSVWLTFLTCVGHWTWGRFSDSDPKTVQGRKKRQIAPRCWSWSCWNFSEGVTSALVSQHLNFVLRNLCYHLLSLRSYSD